MIWKPSGKPSAVLPDGIDIAGSPAMFAGTVKRSDIYIARGSLLFSPNLNGGNGTDGVMIASTSS